MKERLLNDLKKAGKQLSRVAYYEICSKYGFSRRVMAEVFFTPANKGPRGLWKVPTKVTLTKDAEATLARFEKKELKATKSSTKSSVKRVAKHSEEVRSPMCSIPFVYIASPEEINS